MCIPAVKHLCLHQISTNGSFQHYLIITPSTNIHLQRHTSTTQVQSVSAAGVALRDGEGVRCGCDGKGVRCMCIILRRRGCALSRPLWPFSHRPSAAAVPQVMLFCSAEQNPRIKPGTSSFNLYTHHIHYRTTEGELPAQKPQQLRPTPRRPGPGRAARSRGEGGEPARRGGPRALSAAPIGSGTRRRRCAG